MIIFYEHENIEGMHLYWSSTIVLYLHWPSTIVEYVNWSPTIVVYLH